MTTLRRKYDATKHNIILLFLVSKCYKPCVAFLEFVMLKKDLYCFFLLLIVSYSILLECSDVWKKKKKNITAWNGEHTTACVTLIANCLYKFINHNTGAPVALLCGRLLCFFSVLCLHYCFQSLSLIYNFTLWCWQSYIVVKILSAILLALETILFSYRYVSVHCCCLEYINILFSRWRWKVSCSLDMYTAL